MRYALLEKRQRDKEPKAFDVRVKIPFRYRKEIEANANAKGVSVNVLARLVLIDYMEGLKK
jgi:hypothetical protein